MGNIGVAEVASKNGTNPLRVLFFCGERSRWGYSHLVPLLSEPRLELVAVVMATEERWTIFRSALSGEIYKPFGWKGKAKSVVKTLMGQKTLNRTRSSLSTLSKHNVPVLFCDDVNSPASADSFKEYNADLILCAAYPQIFNPELLSVSPKGAFNSHPSLLPRCRGAHPVFWAIASGEKESGATIHHMTRDLDQGDIVVQIAVSLLPMETYSELYAKLANLIPALISKFTTFVVTPGSCPTPQDDTKATYYRNDRRIHHRIFWSKMSATQIRNLVRACEGNAYCWFRDNKIMVHQIKVADTNRNMTNGISVPPGTIVDICDKIPVVATRSEFVSLESLALPKLRKVNFEIGQILH